MSEISLSTRRCVALGVQLRFTRFWIWLPRDADHVPVCLCLGQTGWTAKGVSARICEGVKGIANCEPAIEIRRRDFGIESALRSCNINPIIYTFSLNGARAGVPAAIVYAVPWFDCRFILNRLPPSVALVGTKRRDLRVDYLLGIDWFCLDGLYVIKAATIVAISDGGVVKRVLY